MKAKFDCIFRNSIQMQQKPSQLLFRQINAPDHVENEDVLEALGITVEKVPHAEDDN